jgi:hypothetical protein
LEVVGMEELERKVGGCCCEEVRGSRLLGGWRCFAVIVIVVVVEARGWRLLGGWRMLLALVA